MVDTKVCSSCRTTKPLDEFSKHRQMRLGRESHCKECRARRRRENDVGREENLQRRYGIGIEEYELLFDQQGGVCAICGKPESARYNDGRVRRLAVDHNPKTGKVRGLLCYLCNRRLGFFDSEWGAKALRYWKRRM